MPEQAGTATKNLGKQNSGIFKIVLHLIGPKNRKYPRRRIEEAHLYKWCSRGLGQDGTESNNSGEQNSGIFKIVLHLIGQ